MYLETKRLILRDFTMEDFDGLWEIFRDEETMALMKPMSKEETADFLRSFCVGKRPPGACAAVLRDGGRLVGYLLRNQPDAPGIYELGWVFHRAYWRQGLACEAAAALMGWLFRAENAHKVMAETEDAEKSLPLMEKLGMKREGVFREHCLGTDGQWRDLYWYGLLRKEYEHGNH